jgi:hypothetical protein
MKRNYQTPKAKLVLIRPNIMQPASLTLPKAQAVQAGSTGIKYGGVENTENPVAFSRGGRTWDDEEEK